MSKLPPASLSEKPLPQKPLPQKPPPRKPEVSPFRVMTVMHRAGELERAGRHIIHTEVGEPDFSTAAPIIEAAKRALDQGRTQYTQSVGILPLREAIAERYRRLHGLHIDPRRILVTPGASAGLSMLAYMLAGSGDEVLLADPAYPCVRNFIRMQGAVPRLVPVDAARDYQPQPADLDAHYTEHSRSLWLASPANPAGTVLGRQRLTALCEWARQRGLSLLVDEIYHGLHYIDDLPCVLEIDPDAYVVNGFSKYFGMTGWRLGWIVVPEAALERAMALAQNLYVSAPSIAQYAALAAFDDATIEIFEERRQAFRQRRDYFCAALKDLGFGLPPNIDGAFYAYADISAFAHFADDCEAFCSRMLEEHGLALTPGSDFGEHQAQRHVRFAFTTSMANLEEAVARLQRALG